MVELLSLERSWLFFQTISNLTYILVVRLSLYYIFLNPVRQPVFFWFIYFSSFRSLSRLDTVNLKCFLLVYFASQMYLHWLSRFAHFLVNIGYIQSIGVAVCAIVGPHFHATILYGVRFGSRMYRLKKAILQRFLPALWNFLIQIKDKWSVRIRKFLPLREYLKMFHKSDYSK